MATQGVDDLTRGEIRALAALARRPYGMRSVRAIARAAGVSPSTAARAVKALCRRGLVEHRRITVSESIVRQVENWSVVWAAPAWRRIAPAVSRTQLPEPSPPAERPPCRLPRRFWHLFWDINPARIDLPQHVHYIARRILESGDPRAVAWLVESFPPETLRAVGQGSNRLPEDVRRLANALAGGEHGCSRRPA